MITIPRLVVTWCACFVGTIALAWVPEVGEAWRDGSLAIAMESGATAPQQALDWSGALRDAMATWNGQLQRIQLVAASPTGHPQYDNGRNEVFFSPNFYGQPMPYGVLAVTAITGDIGGRVESDIVVNSDVAWAIYSGSLRAGSPEFRRVMLHELGHVIGLDHPDEAGQHVSAVMNSTISDTDTLTSDDVAGVHALYDRGNGGPPLLASNPAPTRAWSGMPAEFYVGVGGRGPFRYTWQRNGVTIPGATEARLHLDAVHLEDVGNYSATVSNANGSVRSASALLTVIPSERLEAQFVSAAPVTLAAGDDFKLAIRLISGTGPFRVQWTKNGVTVADGDSLGFKLEQVQLGDAGDYAFTITDPDRSSVTSSTVHLSVTPFVPPRFMADVLSASYAIGTRVTLRAPMTGIARATFQWFKDGVPIPFSTEPTLTLPSFSLDDAATYTLVVKTPFGTVTSGGGVLTALEGPGPVLLVPPSGKSEYLGNSVTFYTQADTTAGPLSRRWYKDGELLPPEGGNLHIVGTRSDQLSVREIEARDDGVYTVEISDSRGTTRSMGARLRVLEPDRPIISSHPSAYTVGVGAPVNLTVSLASFGSPLGSAHTPATYQWFKDGTPVAGQTRDSYSFDAQPADTGRYFVRASASNGLFADSEPADVTVTTGPTPMIAQQIGSFYVNALNQDDARYGALSITVNARRLENATGGTVTTNLIQAIPVPPELRSLFIVPPVPGVYTYTVTRNGVSETTRPFTFGFLPAVLPWIRTHPAGQTMKLGASTRLSVGVEASSTIAYRWTKNGAPVPGATTNSLSFEKFFERDVGTYRAIASTSVGSVESEPAVLELIGAGLPQIREHPLSQTAPAGSTISLQVVAEGPGPLRYQWQRNGQPLAGGTYAILEFPAVTFTDGVYTAVVSNNDGSRTSREAMVHTLDSARAPEILIQPLPANTLLGGEATFVVGADGAPLPDRYQWRRDGIDLPGATDARLRLTRITNADAGAYAVVVTNAIGSVTSRPAALTVDAAARLVNLATRANVGTGSNVLIAGFVIGGTKPRTVLVRGIGDQLSQFGVGGVLRNPVLKVFDQRAQQVATSDDWNLGRLSDINDVTRRRQLADAARDVGAFPLRDDTRDAALIATLEPGSYTAQVAGFADTTGVALVEIYELGGPGENRLVNLSSRAVVGTDANILIPGLVISGQLPRRLLVRAIGPGLADLGVSGALGDPTMTIYRDTEVIAQNDNWSEQSSATQVSAAMSSVGAFPLKSGSRDAALLLDLPPGSYTIQVAGVGNTTGVALVEVYEVRP